MRQKRKRRKLRAKPFLWLALLGATVAGIWYSPITAIRKVRIEGAIPADRDRLASLVSNLQGVPCIQIDPRQVESKVLELPEVRTADLGRNPFGSALLRVAYQTPVARLHGSPDVVLSSEGVLYPSLQEVGELPLLQLDKGGPPTLATMAGTWEPQRIAKLAIESRKIDPSNVIRIQVEQGGVVWLNLGAGRVNLGSLDDLDKKIAVLKQRMADFPNELAENEYLNLTQPDSPSLSPRRNR